MSAIHSAANGIYFSDVFGVDPSVLAQYGALNICPWVDIPLFIDPFLLFASEKPEYQALHKQIINYLVYLREHANSRRQLSIGNLKHLYCFKEVHQNCLGFTIDGTRGLGLGPGFGRSLHSNLHSILSNFGSEPITQTAHFEKLSLIEKGVGRDKISDLTTNLIKGFLLEYTEKFTLANVRPSLRKRFNVEKVRFNYDLGVWTGDEFELPEFNGSFILLTPEDLLTKDDTWINKEEFRNDFDHIRSSITDTELRDRISEYFESKLPKRVVQNKYGQPESVPPTKQERQEAIRRTLREFPEIIDHYIKQKEQNSQEAIHTSSAKVDLVKGELILSIQSLVELLRDKSDFFACKTNSVEETRKKIEWFKHVIENQDGYKTFYHQGQPIRLEKNFQAMFKLVWEGSAYSCDAEVNNGRGPVDFKISLGSHDQTLVEFKLASNSSLRENLEHQLEVYKKANRATQLFTVIIYFTLAEFNRVISILNDLDEASQAGIILIDARSDNKPSGSKAR